MKISPSTLLIMAILGGSAAAVRAMDVEALWKKNCTPCHGKDGRGQTPAGRKAGVVNLTDPAIQDKFTDEQLFQAVKHGKKDGDRVKMKPAENLTDKQIKSLIAFVRTLKK